MTELRYPHIQGNHSEQLAQIRGFMYQLVDELNIALERIEQKLEELEQNKNEEESA